MREKIKTNISELEENMELAEDIYHANSAEVLLPEGTILDKKILQAIHLFPVKDQCYIYQEKRIEPLLSLEARDFRIKEKDNIFTPGSCILLELFVRNTGNTIVGNFPVRLYEQEKHLEKSQFLYTGELLPGEETVIEIPYKLPEYSEEQIALKAVINEGPLQTFAKEHGSANYETDTLFIKPSKAKITPLSIKISHKEREFEPGEKINLNLKIKNNGATPQNHFYARLYQEGRYIRGSEKKYNKKPLSPGEEGEMILHYRIPEKATDKIKISAIVMEHSQDFFRSENIKEEGLKIDIPIKQLDWKQKISTVNSSIKYSSVAILAIIFILFVFSYNGFGEAIFGVRDGGNYEDQKIWADEDIINWKDGTYVGEKREGIPHGQGSWEHPRGDRYEGEFAEGKYHGRGVYLWASGAIYEGEFEYNLFHGEGKIINVDGRVYTGEFKEGKMHGEGKYTWPTGATYVGQVKDSLFHGEGIYTWPDGQRFEGEFQEDQIHGYGTMTYPDGTQETGQWQYGQYIEE